MLFTHITLGRRAVQALSVANSCGSHRLFFANAPFRFSSLSVAPNRDLWFLVCVSVCVCGSSAPIPLSLFDFNIYSASSRCVLFAPVNPPFPYVFRCWRTYVREG